MPWPNNRRVIGTDVQRLDAPDKSTGRAKYSFDVNRPNMLHARILRCPHAHARVKNIDTSRAEKVRGFRAFHQLVKPGTELYWAGAEVVAVCADTEEHAEDVMRAVRVDYEVLPHLVRMEDALEAKQQTVQGNNVNPGGEYSTENFEQQAFQGARARSESQFSVPVVCHQCLESHGLVAEWDKELANLTVWASTQAVPNTVRQLAAYFKIPVTRVVCITNHMGGGYGSKFGPDIQGIACAELARKARAPVKLMLDRAEEVIVGGMRPSAKGTVRMAADNNNRIQAFEIDVHGSPGVGGAAGVNFRLLPYVYTEIPNIRRRNRIVKLNFQTSRAMRAPGHPQNCYLTDQALDDLAAQLNVNPLELRLANLPPNDPDAQKNDPTSYLALRHTIYTDEIRIARKLSQWDKKWHAPGKGGNGPIKRGIGMALHTWGGGGRPNNDTRTAISADGSVLVQASTQDLGTGQRTVEAIITAEVLGLNPTDITVDIGDSRHGRSTPSGGSTTTPGTAPAIYNAAVAARDQLFQMIAKRLNARPEDLRIEPGHVVNRQNNQRTPWRQACSRLGQGQAVGTGDFEAGYTNQGVGGVQIAEVEVDTETGIVKCTHVTAVQDCGMIVNKLCSESQVAGGVIMGVNYALFEEQIMDRRTGRQVNPDMEFYKLGGIQDIPRITVHMHDMPQRGVIGIGEPPTISTAAAIGNAVFNALGVRVPDAPFTPERVLHALTQRGGK